VTVLKGLLGNTPFHFLASLGVLHALERSGVEAKLSWDESDHPVIHHDAPFFLEALSQGISATLEEASSVLSEFDLDTLDGFTQAVKACRGDRNKEDILASLGCKGSMGAPSSKLMCLKRGELKKTLVNVQNAFSSSNLEGDLYVFKPLQDLAESLTFRWTIETQRNWATRGSNPRVGSDHPYTSHTFEALAFCAFCSFTPGKDRSPPGFFKYIFRWPLWSHPLSLNAIKSLLCLDEPPDKLRLRSVFHQFEAHRRVPKEKDVIFFYRTQQIF